MSGFNLNDASEKNVSVYQEPGIHDNVKVTKVDIDESAVKKSKYLLLTTEGPNGEIGKSNKMFLSNVKGEGKQTTAWAITARNLVDLIMAATNVSEEEAKAKINVENETQLVAKVSAILIGKPFRGKFKGEQSQKGLVFASLAQVESMEVVPTKMKFNADKDIKKYEGNGAINTAPVSSDLPF